MNSLGLGLFSDFSRDRMTSCQFGSRKRVLTLWHSHAAKKLKFEYLGQSMKNTNCRANKETKTATKRERARWNFLMVR